MGLRPTNRDEKHAGGECRANMAGLRGVFFRGVNMGLRPTNRDEKHAGAECRANMAGLRGVFFRGVSHGPTAHQ